MLDADLPPAIAALGILHVVLNITSLIRPILFSVHNAARRTRTYPQPSPRLSTSSVTTGEAETKAASAMMKKKKKDFMMIDKKRSSKQ